MSDGGDVGSKMFLILELQSEGTGEPEFSFVSGCASPLEVHPMLTVAGSINKVIHKPRARHTLCHKSNSERPGRADSLVNWRSLSEA